MQDIKMQFIPEFKRLMILCYFCGVINTSACLYWLRSSRKDLDRLRFYYGMGIASIVGETAMGIFGASCCKSMSVSEDNPRMKKLLEFVGLKSIREIALTDAVATVRQVSTIRSHWFCRDGGKRSRRKPIRYGCTADNNFNSNEHEAVVKAGLPKCISEEISSSKALIGDVSSEIHLGRPALTTASCSLLLKLLSAVHP
jgi:hypothetical protein